MKAKEHKDKVWGDYHAAMDKAVEYDQRICFGIAFFKTEEDANEAGKAVRAAGITYNGGYFHGMPCGRDTSFDYEDKKLGKLYAVTY